MEERDADVARRELGVDSDYKTRGMDIERECMILQAPPGPRAREPQASVHRSIRKRTNSSGLATLSEHICHAIVDTAECERDEDLETARVERASTARKRFRRGS